MIIFNYFIFLFCLWVSWYVYSEYIKNTLNNRNVFKLFSLRDRLHLMVMAGKLPEESIEYNASIRSINCYIKATKEFEVITLLRVVRAYCNSEDLRKEWKEIKEKIENHSPELKQIWIEYHEVLRKILNKRLRLIIAGLIATIAFLEGLRISISIFHTVMVKLQEVQISISEIQTDIDFFSNLQPVSVRTR